MYRHVQICTFSIKPELLENRTIEFPINWHSVSSLLRRPTFQKTAPGSFSNSVKYRTQVNILSIFCPECIYDFGFANNPQSEP